MMNTLFSPPTRTKQTKNSYRAKRLNSIRKTPFSFKMYYTTRGYNNSMHEKSKCTEECQPVQHKGHLLTERK